MLLIQMRIRYRAKRETFSGKSSNGEVERLKDFAVVGCFVMRDDTAARFSHEPMQLEGRLRIESTTFGRISPV